MTTIRLATAADLPQIAQIYNEGIEDRSATFETRLRSTEQIRVWLDRIDRFPLLVAIDGEEQVQGWAGLSPYRERDCYAGVAEFSVYVGRDQRGSGVGIALMQALIAAATQRGYWKLLSRIFTFNQASRRLCRSCGFHEVGTYHKHAQLDGRWLDVVIVERLIPSNQPENLE